MSGRDAFALLQQLIASGLFVREGGRILWGQAWIGRALMVDGDLHAGSRRRPYVLGLTGNIAMGKSTVLSILATLGAETIDADSLVRDLRAPDGAAYAPLVQHFGERILKPDGYIDASLLGEIAFRDKRVLTQLEELFGPLVVEEVERRIASCRLPVVVVEAIRLHEGSLGQRVDQVWVVDAPREVQIERLISTRHLTREQAVNRIESQNPQAAKLRQADVVLQNSGDLVSLKRQVLDAWDAALISLPEGVVVTASLVSAYIRQRISLFDPTMSESAMMVVGTLAHHMPQTGLAEDEVLSLLCDQGRSI